jgi:hypothetical protein
MTIKERYFDLVEISHGFSRVGGGMPTHLITDARAHQGQRFLLTLSHVDFPELGESNLSVLLDSDVASFNEVTVYPDIGVACIFHPPCAEDDTGQPGRMAALSRGHLISQTTHGDGWFVKFGGAPELIQEEDHHQRAVLDAGFEFLLQIDENGYPDGFLSGNYPFGYGALYIYAKFDGTGRIVDAVAGFTQF